MLRLVRANDQLSQGELAQATGNLAGALAHYRSAPLMAPGDVEIAYWSAVLIANQGSVDESIPMFRAAFAASPTWLELTRRMEAASIMKGPVIERVIREATP